MEDKRADVRELEKRLKPRERLFAEEYIRNGWNGTAAALEAGYGKTRESAAVQACRILRREPVQAYMRARTREIYAQLFLSPERVAGELVRLYRRATQAEPVMVYDKEAEKYVESGEYQYDAKNAVKILEMLGQHAGMFVQKVEQTTIQKGPLEGLSTEELRALIRLLDKDGAQKDAGEAETKDTER